MTAQTMIDTEDLVCAIVAMTAFCMILGIGAVGLIAWMHLRSVRQMIKEVCTLMIKLKTGDEDE